MTQKAKAKAVELIEVDGVWVSKLEAQKNDRQGQAQEVQHEQAQSKQAHKTKTHEQTQKPRVVMQRTIHASSSVENAFDDFLDGFEYASDIFFRVFKHFK